MCQLVSFHVDSAHKSQTLSVGTACISESLQDGYGGASKVSFIIEIVFLMKVNFMSAF